MDSTSIEQMKKIIEERKNKASQKSNSGKLSNKRNAASNKGFKKDKRAGSLNK